MVGPGDLDKWNFSGPASEKLKPPDFSKIISWTIGLQELLFPNLINSIKI